MEGLILPPTKNRVLTLCLYFSPYKSPPKPSRVELHPGNIKGRLCVLELMTACFPICLSGAGLRRKKEGLIDKQQLLLGVRVPSPLSYINVRGCACVRATKKENNSNKEKDVERKMSSTTHTVSVATTAKQDFQAHLTSSALRCENCLFFC